MTFTNAQWLHMIFTTALEGGINYWSECERYHWSVNDDGQTDDLDGFFADIIEIGDGDLRYPLRIDRTTIARGYYLAARTVWQTKIYWSSERPPFILGPETDWDFDAADADVIVQLGLFEEVIYG